MIALISGAYLIYKSLVYSEVIAGLELAVVLGALQGMLFLFANVFRFEARKVFPNHVVLPLTKTSVLIVIITSWLLFGEFASVTANRLVGLTLIGLSIYLFREYEGGKTSSEEARATQVAGAFPDDSGKRKKTAVIYLALATVVSAAISLLSKYAVGPSNLDIFLFMFLSNYAICIAAFLLFHQQTRSIRKETRRRRRHKLAKQEVSSILKRGMSLGLLNFIAFACLLRALSLGDASLVIPIYSLYVVIPVIMSAVFHGVLLTQKATVAVILSISAVIILD